MHDSQTQTNSKTKNMCTSLSGLHAQANAFCFNASGRLMRQRQNRQAQPGPHRPSSECSDAVGELAFSSSALPMKMVFLHGWRRHVCRDCTGHLALVERELLARLDKGTNKSNQKPTNKQTHTTPTPATWHWHVA